MGTFAFAVVWGGGGGEYPNKTTAKYLSALSIFSLYNTMNITLLFEVHCNAYNKKSLENTFQQKNFNYFTVFRYAKPSLVDSV